MGIKFFDNLGGTSVYNCESCGVYLSNKNEVLSTNFTGVTGQAYLFKTVTNVQLGSCEQREMMTGLHYVRDVFCSNCGKKIGWMYELAINETERYKEGAITLEKKLIKKVDGLAEDPIQGIHIEGQDNGPVFVQENEEEVEGEAVEQGREFWQRRMDELHAMYTHQMNAGVRGGPLALGAEAFAAIRRRGARRAIPGTRRTFQDMIIEYQRDVDNTPNPYEVNYLRNLQEPVRIPRRLDPQNIPDNFNAEVQQHLNILREGNNALRENRQERIAVEGRDEGIGEDAAEEARGGRRYDEDYNLAIDNIGSDHGEQGDLEPTSPRFAIIDERNFFDYVNHWPAPAPRQNQDQQTSRNREV